MKHSKDKQIDSYQISLSLIRARVSFLENTLSRDISYLYKVAIQKELEETKKDLSLLVKRRKGKNQ